MKTVAYSCPFVPPEWIAAHGLRPTLLVPESLGVDAAAGPTAGVCSFARAAAHAAMMQDGIDAYVATSICDQRRRATELAARRSDKPVFMMHVPAACRTTGSRDLYLAELRRLGQFLVHLGGRAPARDELVWQMSTYSRARATLAHMAEGRSAREVALSFWKLGEDGPTAEQSPPWVLQHDRPQASPAGVPILLLGGPLMRDGLALLDVLEQSGARVAVNATENGPASIAAPFRPMRSKRSPLGELARAYYDHIAHPFSRPNVRLYEWLAGALASSRARGILFVRYVWCDLWHAELARLKQWSPVPVVDVDLAAGEDAAGARLKGRVQALMEMLA